MTNRLAKIVAVVVALLFWWVPGELAEDIIENK